MTHTCSITNNGVTSIWQVDRVWDACKNLPINEQDIETLIPFLKEIVWWQEDKLSAWDCVIHAKRILDADMSYPIILDGNGQIIDGGHRLAKAWITGVRTIKYYQLVNMPKPIDVIESL